MGGEKTFSPTAGAAGKALCLFSAQTWANSAQSSDLSALSKAKAGSGTCHMPLNVPVPVQSGPCCHSTGSPGHRDLTGQLAMAVTLHCLVAQSKPGLPVVPNLCALRSCWTCTHPVSQEILALSTPPGARGSIPVAEGSMGDGPKL